MWVDDLYMSMVPWGRGNGWALFSISELLKYLPEEHKDRSSILEFFKSLCEGYLTLQGSRGLWHQVLTLPESYVDIIDHTDWELCMTKLSCPGVTICICFVFNYIQTYIYIGQLLSDSHVCLSEIRVIKDLW